MSQQQQPRRPPVTYGDVFPSVHGELAAQPVAPKDAALMQSAEAIGLGQSQKGGAAAAMQSAAARNVNAGVVSKDAGTVAGTGGGFSVVVTAVPGNVFRAEYVSGQPVSVSSEPTPAPPAIASKQDAITIGEALEAVAIGAGDEPVEPADARAIQSAEKRAVGMPLTEGGGVAATAQSAADLNPRAGDQAKTTLADVLADASQKLAADKMATREDAEKIEDVERRSRPSGEIRKGGVAAAVKAAADFNEEIYGGTGHAYGGAGKQQQL